MASNYNYPLRVAIGFDQFVNTLLGGEPDETISARLYRHRRLPWWCIGHAAVNALFFWQWRPTRGGHCQQSWQAEIDRAQLGESYRKKEVRGVEPGACTAAGTGSEKIASLKPTAVASGSKPIA